MNTTGKQHEKESLNQAMDLLIKVQLGNENQQVESKLDAITDDLDALIGEEYSEPS